VLLIGLAQRKSESPSLFMTGVVSILGSKAPIEDRLLCELQDQGAIFFDDCISKDGFHVLEKDIPH
jgi:hypothetical protein